MRGRFPIGYGGVQSLNPQPIQQPHTHRFLLSLSPPAPSACMSLCLLCSVDRVAGLPQPIHSHQTQASALIGWMAVALLRSAATDGSQSFVQSHRHTPQHRRTGFSPHTPTPNNSHHGTCARAQWEGVACLLGLLLGFGRDHPNRTIEQSTPAPCLGLGGR